MARRTKALALACALAAAALVAAALVPGAAAIQCTANPNDRSPGPSDRVVYWSRACDDGANVKCDSCLLWNMAAAYKSLPSFYSGSKSGAPRAKIIPTRALPGLESIVRDKHDLSGLFTKALSDASKGGVLPNKGTTLPAVRFPIAFINSLSAREQHQTHIHVGAVEAGNTNFTDCVKQILQAPPATNKWTGASAYDPKSAACQALKVKHNVAITATSTPGNNISNAIRAGFLGKHVEGAQNPDIATDPALIHTGVLVQMNPKNNKEYLVFLLSNVNDITVFGNKT